MDPFLDLLYITVLLLCTPKLLLNAYSHPHGHILLRVWAYLKSAVWFRFRRGSETARYSHSHRKRENQNLWRPSTLSALIGKMPSVEVLLDVALMDVQSMLSIPLLGRDELLCDDASAFAVGATYPSILLALSL